MTDRINYIKTAKGRAELATGTGTLERNARNLLGLVDDQSTFDDLKSKLGEVAEDKLRAAFDRLVKDGYIEAAQRPAPAEEELDFTHELDTPAPEPTAQQKAQAEQQTLGGMRTLKQAGYYVNITNRPRQRQSPRSGEKYGVLIIDGDQGNTLLLARTLMLANFDVRSATTRDEILAVLRKTPLPDAIVMDIVLPRLNGLDLLSRLRLHQQFESVPIIIVTSKTAQGDVVAALARGASGYMTKPFKPEALVESVKAVLGLG